jgi:protein-S-isoprenylcysteine O-methyltransferase Ste14
LFMAVGIYFISASYVLLKKHKTAIDFEKSTFLVTEGVYKYTSNPMYFGAFLFLLGTSILMGNIISFAAPIAFFVVINYMFIPFEEEKGELEFGGEYKEYKKKTKKWI